MKIKKRAIFFSTDAVIATGIILLTILIAFPLIEKSQDKLTIQKDAIKSLSEVKINEINNSQIKTLISQGEIEDKNKTFLEQIAESYVTNKTIAKELSQVFFSYVNTTENFGIWFGDELIASKNSTPIESAKKIQVERQIISGIKQGNETTGYSVRAYLSSDLQTKYFYFGGYIGDGNLSTMITYEGNISSAEIEIAINKDFEISINGEKIGNYSKSPNEFEPVKYTLPISNFSSGNNLIELKGESLHVAGGYIKLTYAGSSDLNSTKYFLPGIKGAINLYDGIFTKDLQEMNIKLVMQTNYTTFLTIANKTVFKNKTNGTQTIMIDNAELSSILDYNSLKNQTIPIRLGLENASYLKNGTLNADVFSVTDLSGSMRDGCIGTSPWWCCWFNNCNIPSGCSACSGTWEEKLTSAKQANNAFIDGILNYSGNKIGLVTYATSYIDGYSHNLSTNKTSLKSKVTSWVANGNTCICCGINEAVNKLNLQSLPSRSRSLVVMSDGEANVRCAQQGTGSASQDAIQAACDAYNNFGIKIYAVGFGDGADETTLQQIATCGNGTYYYGDASEIVDLYGQIAKDLINATYNEQTINITTDFDESILEPESYIEIISNQEQVPFGLIITIEKEFDDSNQGHFNVPLDSKILSARVISYSGPRWTDKVILNNNIVYKLSDYGTDYKKLGDPYSITLPNSLIQESNKINLTTGISTTNSSQGSPKNKIIYKIIKNSSSYSAISPKAEGCIWQIEFEDSSIINMNIPEDYSGTNTCIYNSSDINYDSNDAMQEAAYRLFKILDIDSNYKIDSKFTEQNLVITPNEITGIPYTWSTEMQIRAWR